MVGPEVRYSSDLHFYRSPDTSSATTHLQWQPCLCWSMACRHDAAPPGTQRGAHTQHNKRHGEPARSGGVTWEHSSEVVAHALRRSDAGRVSGQHERSDGADGSNGRPAVTVAQAVGCGSLRSSEPTRARRETRDGANGTSRRDSGKVDSAQTDGRGDPFVSREIRRTEYATACRNALQLTTHVGRESGNVVRPLGLDFGKVSRC